MIYRDTILLEHVITEKATEASSHANQYTFKVAGEANRVSVKQAIEGQFGVEVAQVRIANVKPKFKQDRMRRGRVSRRSGYKKAIVRLKEGSAIEMA
ncbi:MAG TPA: 50S ribosomal protein L23 [Oceanipulchritudo sp.]|nr:50S ribosomal protein L23 [Oceanipulchritudo sp.]